MTNHMVIGGTAEPGHGASFHAIEAATGQPLDGTFNSASEDQLDRACALADAAADAFRDSDPVARAALLEGIADAIMALGDDLIVRAMAESGLPRARLEGERGRTCGQLRMFAGVVRAGHYLDARIDPAMPDRAPLPRPDLRLRNIALGPVAVFGASNFPLAFSVAGGDTASALAAGCPVVAKAHPAHPGTSALVGEAIRQAVAKSGLPGGIFSLLFDAGIAIGAALVADPRIRAVGFTGSRRGGLALIDIARARPEPIPVYAEMSSINPVLLMPHALDERAEAIGTAFAQSLALGAGQFCTNPGLVLGIAGPALDRFTAAAREAVAALGPATMLTPGIAAAYRAGSEAVAAHGAVDTLARGQAGNDYQCRAALFSTSAAAFLAHHALQDEVFGATSLIVRCTDVDDMRAIIDALEGQLTASIHMSAGDHDLVRPLLPRLERRVGRILVNGFGTGVEVAHAMVHGGPFPATSDARTTSVGSLAIARFLRPVCYQDLPDDLLPDALKAANPLGLTRMIDGKVEVR